MKDFENFMRANKDKIDALAEANTKRNSAGQTVISRDDPWFNEDEWGEIYMKGGDTVGREEKSANTFGRATAFDIAAD